MKKHSLFAFLFTVLAVSSCNNNSSSSPGKANAKSKQNRAEATKLSSTNSEKESSKSHLPAGHPPTNPQAAGHHPSAVQQIDPTSSAATNPTLAITWKEPAAWKKVPSSSKMRHSTYHIAGGKADQHAEMAVFYFGANQGGSVDQNMQRWSSQFSDVDPKNLQRNTRTMNGMEQHTIEIKEGSFSAGMMAAAAPTPQAKSKFGLLGAIVVAPSGSYFFKLTGPTEIVASARKDFFGLLDSIKNREK